MGDIVLLDEHTINKIAAGEVVDRPASIVKELVENSIDAGATSVSVEIKKGGISYIKIMDNGIGFHSDDIEMAFERHATSKIRKEEDLLTITSMGFRGEALASVAAISKVTLTTRNKDEEIGTKALVASGKIEEITQTAYNQGTKIEIRDVFYNVPARFKFLKKDYTEAGYIEDVIIRIALSNPHISFKYINNGKITVQTSGKGDLRSTIYDIFGKDIYQNVIPVEYELNGIKVCGMIGLPVISRSTRMHQFTFVNSRYIKDKTINSAIDKACSEKYAINKFAFVVLNIKINPSHIDVNVHPAKLEIKFENETEIFQAIYAAVRTAIEKKQTEDSPFTNIKKDINESKENSNVILNNNVPISKEPAELKRFESKISTPISYNNPMTSSVPSLKLEEPITKYEVSNSNNLEKVLENNQINISGEIKKENEKTGINEEQESKNIVDNSVINTSEQVKINYNETNVLTVNAENHVEPIMYKYIGQVFDTYIIIQIDQKMYIIDQHAAHERLLYEQIKSSYYAKDKQSQLLLIPILVELTFKEKSVVTENMDMFEKSGFVIEDFGDNTVKISGVPNIGYDIDYKSMFKDIIDELLGAPRTEKSDKEFRFLATLACKAAVKGNMKLDEKEQRALISEMVKLDRPFTCPHGRPTAYEITKYEIERRFLRK